MAFESQSDWVDRIFPEKLKGDALLSGYGMSAASNLGLIPDAGYRLTDTTTIVAQGYRPLYYSNYEFEIFIWFRANLLTDTKTPLIHSEVYGFFVAISDTQLNVGVAGVYHGSSINHNLKSSSKEWHCLGVKKITRHSCELSINGVVLGISSINDGEYWHDKAPNMGYMWSTDIEIKQIFMFNRYVTDSERITILQGNIPDTLSATAVSYQGSDNLTVSYYDSALSNISSTSVDIPSTANRGYPIYVTKTVGPKNVRKLKMGDTVMVTARITTTATTGLSFGVAAFSDNSYNTIMAFDASAMSPRPDLGPNMYSGTARVTALSGRDDNLCVIALSLSWSGTASFSISGMEVKVVGTDMHLNHENILPSGAWMDVSGNAYDLFPTGQLGLYYRWSKRLFVRTTEGYTNAGGILGASDVLLNIDEPVYFSIQGGSNNTAISFSPYPGQHINNGQKQKDSPYIFGSGQIVIRYIDMAGVGVLSKIKGVVTMYFR